MLPSVFFFHRAYKLSWAVIFWDSIWLRAKKLGRVLINRTRFLSVLYSCIKEHKIRYYFFFISAFLLWADNLVEEILWRLIKHWLWCWMIYLSFLTKTLFGCFFLTLALGWSSNLSMLHLLPLQKQQSNSRYIGFFWSVLSILVKCLQSWRPPREGMPWVWRDVVLILTGYWIP